MNATNVLIFELISSNKLAYAGKNTAKFTF